MGNLHGGHGKALVRSKAEGFEVADLLFAAKDDAVVELYIDDRRDVRCLALRDRCWAMTRAGAEWKAHVRS